MLEGRLQVRRLLPAREQGVEAESGKTERQKVTHKLVAVVSVDALRMHTKQA